jgi:hypothetical protein|tara:strand:+ start:34 stop:327 length:294 start_codon:yes stop_codon:yes gene_type:complete
MIINVGDTIKGNHGRIGEIINIGIATEKADIAAESDNSLNAQTYDTSLGYIGAITYTGEQGTNWCYFHQIQENLTETKEESELDVSLTLVAENERGK